jgi:hypothetical protein
MLNFRTTTYGMPRSQVHTPVNDFDLQINIWAKNIGKLE